jgi:hypothetical protein
MRRLRQRTLLPAAEAEAVEELWARAIRRYEI